VRRSGDLVCFVERLAYRAVAESKHEAITCGRLRLADYLSQFMDAGALDEIDRGKTTSFSNIRYEFCAPLAVTGHPVMEHCHVRMQSAASRRRCIARRSHSRGVATAKELTSWPRTTLSRAGQPSKECHRSSPQNPRAQLQATSKPATKASKSKRQNE
jgi:hypothetical protein